MLKLQEQFQQAQKLESIGRLAGGIAHDFNNLLTVILSCSEALRHDLPAADAQVRGVTVRALRDAGDRVLVAANGGEALDMAAQQDGRVDLVVTDVVMPGLSGRAVVKELQRRQPALRAQYVSGYTQDTIAQRGVLEAGVQFLPKPFTPAALLSRVREVLDDR
jgi:CheY-like chemotaxis protein